MDLDTKTAPAKFGTVIGVAPGNVFVYSSDYESADDDELPTRQAYRSYVDDVYMGHKWQCVEFARRWLYVNYGYVFDDIAMAYDIFRLETVRVVRENRLLPLRSFRNGAKRPPEPGCLLIWEEGGEFETTGHVAIVTEVTREYVRIVEQNVGDRVWPAGQNYSREIKAEATSDGHYWLECSFGDATILGWTIQTDDDTHAERFAKPDSRLFALQARELTATLEDPGEWLNVANADEAAYVTMMKGHKLSGRDTDLHKYYCLSESALAELRRATNELHALFLHATNYVLDSDSRLARFNIPRALWPKIRQSWNNRRTQMITGRFDFSLSERGLKVYEYNCDSASCHMEAGKIQGRWARHFGCDDGSDPGRQLHERLRDAWRHSDVDSVLHIMQDDDPEETYHALFMQEAMEAGGISSKIVRGISDFRWAEDGGILDADGVPVRWVWKTWAWETALDQLRAECEDDEIRLPPRRAGADPKPAPRLVDVLLRREIMVYEPLWTLIPSNKAILPVLWQMFPDYPYLLNSSYELTDELRAGGYVEKPIVGRGGANISMFDGDLNLRAETGGQFDDRDQVYQELFALPFVGGYNVQVSTFSSAGRYAGACVRVDESPVINMRSDNLAVRIVSDRELTRT
ncbi:MAG: bifunctional glutathionylspermidine amidase/synthase [Gammaproteobacteria bacterium]|nr:bifunctional glutathionylspermidine amidase/synthase [Gammaproteobacteria bacterium]MDH3505732.1 bifunctional glutathionylspermidine amidase/synthase [Gammaproteobacteria bacterium]